MSFQLLFPIEDYMCVCNAGQGKVARCFTVAPSGKMEKRSRHRRASCDSQKSRKKQVKCARAVELLGGARWRGVGGLVVSEKCFVL